MKGCALPLQCVLAFGIAVATSACGETQSPTGPDSTLPFNSDPSPGAQGCSRTSVGFTPLTDLRGEYRGQPGGLYPGGTNTRPGGHEAAGLTLARAIGPLDPGGLPHANGAYVLMSIGMSNATLEFSTFKTIADEDPGRDPRLVVVDAAQGGVTAIEWSNSACRCWDEVERRLSSAGVTSKQVAVAWMKMADARPTGGWPAHAQRLKDEQIGILRILHTRFPNIRLAYLSSRVYAGYAQSELNPEPYAYESGFAVRWTIEEQLNGSALPWVSWGPYLWADGATPRGDGLTWPCSDFRSDGTHLSDAGQRKVADMLLRFFRSDVTAREWYLANP